MNTKSKKEIQKEKKKETQRQKQREADRMRSDGIMKKAISGETTGRNAGMPRVTLQARVYNPSTRRDIDLPGEKLVMRVDGIKTVRDALKVSRRALDRWMATGDEGED